MVPGLEIVKTSIREIFSHQRDVFGAPSPAKSRLSAAPSGQHAYGFSLWDLRAYYRRRIRRETCPASVHQWHLASLRRSGEAG